MTPEEFNMLTAQKFIEKLGLIPHPEEGGFYRETYRSGEIISQAALPKRYKSDRTVGTAIYYFLIPGTCSRLHRLLSDEIFHFYLGDPINMLLLYPDGKSQEIILGPDLMAGHQMQVVVPRGVWQGSLLKVGGKYALLGTTVAPGFDYEDYEAGEREDLICQYPGNKELITRLTPENEKNSR
jgi:uncharacterized protein